MADVVLRRAVDKMDPVATYMNMITAKAPQGARIPLTVDTDRQALYVALACCLKTEQETAHIARIEDTKHLETFWASEHLLPDSSSLDGWRSPGISGRLRLTGTGCSRISSLQRRVADGGAERVINSLQDLLAKRRHGQSGIGVQVEPGLEKRLQTVDLLDEPRLTAGPQVEFIPQRSQFQSRWAE